MALQSNCEMGWAASEYVELHTQHMTGYVCPHLC